ncbi:hypothetical protein B0H19DRAFT_1309995 [Mycena capillaripes]|nr:hypothetical protein B0H19DRAFT_1309995 [Mycena capillaripes]
MTQNKTKEQRILDREIHVHSTPSQGRDKTPLKATDLEDLIPEPESYGFGPARSGFGSEIFQARPPPQASREPTSMSRRGTIEPRDKGAFFFRDQTAWVEAKLEEKSSWNQENHLKWQKRKKRKLKGNFPKREAASASRSHLESHRSTTLQSVSSAVIRARFPGNWLQKRSLETHELHQLSKTKLRTSIVQQAQPSMLPSP